MKGGTNVGLCGNLKKGQKCQNKNEFMTIKNKLSKEIYIQNATLKLQNKIPNICNPPVTKGKLSDFKS